MSKKLLDKLRIPGLANRDEATALAVATAELELMMDKIALMRDERLEKIRLEFDLQIEEFQRAIKSNIKRLASWSTANRAAEFGKDKIIYLGGHKLAFREGTGRVAFSDEVDEEEVMDFLLSHPDPQMADRFITVKSSLNKNSILQAMRHSTVLGSELYSAGLRVLKDEKFSFEPNRDIPTRPDAVPVEGKEQS